MIPENIGFTDVRVIRQPTYTYQFDFEKNRIVKYTDGIEAMKQFVFKALRTDRYRHEIYDWNYGIEIDDLMGKPITYAKAKLPGRITDALITDDRVLAVENFVYTESNDRKTTVCIEFTVRTVFGDFKGEYSKEF